MDRLLTSRKSSKKKIGLQMIKLLGIRINSFKTSTRTIKSFNTRKGPQTIMYTNGLTTQPSTVLDI